MPRRRRTPLEDPGAQRTSFFGNQALVNNPLGRTANGIPIQGPDTLRSPLDAIPQRQVFAPGTQALERNYGQDQAFAQANRSAQSRLARKSASTGQDWQPARAGSAFGKRTLSKADPLKDLDPVSRARVEMIEMQKQRLQMEMDRAPSEALRQAAQDKLNEMNTLSTIESRGRGDQRGDRAGRLAESKEEFDRRKTKEDLRRDDIEFRKKNENERNRRWEADREYQFQQDKLDQAKANKDVAAEESIHKENQVRSGENFTSSMEQYYALKNSGTNGTGKGIPTAEQKWITDHNRALIEKFYSSEVSRREKFGGNTVHSRTALEETDRVQKAFMKMQSVVDKYGLDALRNGDIQTGNPEQDKILIRNLEAWEDAGYNFDQSTFLGQTDPY